VQYDNKDISGIELKFKKKNNSQIEMAVKLDNGLKNGWYAVLLFDRNNDMFIDVYWMFVCDFSESD